MRRPARHRLRRRRRAAIARDDAGDAFGGDGIISEIEILRGDLAELLLRGDQARHRVPVRRHGHRPRPGRRRRRRRPSRRRRRAGSSWSSAPTGCTRRSARWRSARSRSSCGRSGCYTGLVHRAGRARPRRLVPDVQRPRRPRGLAAARPAARARPRPACASAPTPIPATTAATPPPQRRLLARAVRRRAGWKAPRLLDAMRAAADFTFDAMGQVPWTAGRAAGSRWSATPATARPRSPGWAPASRWSARTCWPASSPRAGRRPRARRSRATRSSCGPTSTRRQELPPGGDQRLRAAEPAGDRAGQPVHAAR